ncbi:MAG: hypothetical protein KF774_04230 [Planctomyces sp.]|nr:hypothetical protein [Planctomyces sp.]
MSRLERLMLYGASLGLLMLLVAGERGPFQTAHAFSDPPAAAEGGLPDGDRLQIRDESGRVRIDIGIDAEGQPAITLRHRDGATALKLEALADQQARIVLGEDGATMALTSDRNGAQQIAMNVTGGAGMQLSLAVDGASEVRLDGADQSPQVSLSRTATGEAHILLRPQSGKGNVFLRANPAGLASVHVTASDGQSGPVLAAHEDGVAEMAIGSSDGSGPSMIRLPDGMTIISARRVGGEPGASMVVSPDGRAVVAATNAEGSRGAELRIDEQGVPRFGAFDANRGNRPAPAPAPRRQQERPQPPIRATPEAGFTFQPAPHRTIDAS